MKAQSALNSETVARNDNSSDKSVRLDESARLNQLERGRKTTVNARLNAKKKLSAQSPINSHTVA